MTLKRRMVPVRRFGLHGMVAAEEYAERLVGDGTNVTHIVEVFDEERGTAGDSDPGQAGVLYVVEAKAYEEFSKAHNHDLHIIQTFGSTPNEGERA